MDINAIVEDQNPWWRLPNLRASRPYPVRRDLQREILRRLLDLKDRRAMMILGPRQVGKTTLLLQTVDDLLDGGWPAPNLTYFDFSDDRVIGTVTAREVAEVRPAGFDPEQPRALLLDEVRLAPNWADWLKQTVDRSHGRQRIAVSDSAASLLREAGRESGQGRWDEHRLEGLSFLEFSRLWSGSESSEPVIGPVPNLLERFLAAGGFPEHVLTDDLLLVRRRLRSDIVERAILRDLAGLVESIEPVRDLFVYLVQDSGAIFNARERGSDLGKDERSIRRWVSLLEDTFLIATLPRHTVRLSSRLRTRPKLYAADHGLIAAFKSLAGEEPAVRGQIFEAAVFRHLRDVARELGGELSYFRYQQDLEIDFVLETDEERVAIEVTSSQVLKPKRLERLAKASGQLEANRALLVHGGLAEKREDRLTALPLERFLTAPLASVSGSLE